jgi:hypothetical protein
MPYSGAPSGGSPAALTTQSSVLPSPSARVTKEYAEHSRIGPPPRATVGNCDEASQLAAEGVGR